VQTAPITTKVVGRSWRGVLDTTVCDQVCQWLATGRWFSPGTPVSSTNTADHHDMTEKNVESGTKHHNPNPLDYIAWTMCKIIMWSWTQRSV